MSFSQFQKASCAVELTCTASTGTYVAFKVGSTVTPLQHPPVQIIFDNQGTNAFLISIDGSNTWRTFPAGEALVLDMVTNRGATADYFSFPQGTQFYGKGTTGDTFSISYTYAS